MKVYERVVVQRYSLLTSAQDGGEWSAHASAALPPEKDPLVPLESEGGWAPEPVWTILGEGRGSLLPFARNRTTIPWHSSP